MNTRACQNISAEIIKGAIPYFGLICTSEKQKESWLKSCRINIKFAKTSKLIAIYCGCSNIDWDEEGVRKRIIKKNKEEIARIEGIKINNKYICEVCGIKTNRRGITKGLRRKYLCCNACEAEIILKT